jgi:hypothetical protein
MATRRKKKVPTVVRMGASLYEVERGPGNRKVLIPLTKRSKRWPPGKGKAKR